MKLKTRTSEAEGLRAAATGKEQNELLCLSRSLEWLSMMEKVPCVLAEQRRSGELDSESTRVDCVGPTFRSSFRQT